jgi:uncharacterized repeat protein (TIGR02543 family)
MNSSLRSVLLLGSCLALASCGSVTSASSGSVIVPSSGTGTQATSQDTSNAAKFDVTFHLNYSGAVEPYKVISVAVNSPVSQPSDPSRDGYSFGGWFLDTYAVTAYDFTEKITAATSLYAGWSASGSSSASSSSSSSASTSTPTSSESSVASSLLYFKDTTWWAKDGATTNIYFFSGTTAGPVAWPGVNMTSVGQSSDGHGIFSIDLSNYSSYTDIVFCRSDPKGTLDWGAKTVNLSLADRGSNNMYDVSSVTVEAWGDPGITGVWATYNA